jgi:hypothetical protein
MKEGKVMTKYEITMTFNYVINTDDIEKTLEHFEFPSFLDIDADTEVEFQGNTNVWKEVGADE